jgi:hypothetical protein
MNNPALTWRVRRIGHTLWSSVRTRNRTAWSWIERVQRAAEPNSTSRAAPTISSIADEPCEMNDAYHWLAALRLDRAAAAVADPD